MTAIAMAPMKTKIKLSQKLLSPDFLNENSPNN